MQNLIELVIYLAIGLLVHLLAYGPVDWADAWVYVIVGLWPFVLIWWGIFYIIGVAILFIIICAAVAAWESRRKAN